MSTPVSVLSCVAAKRREHVPVNMSSQCPNGERNALAADKNKTSTLEVKRWQNVTIAPPAAGIGSLSLAPNQELHISHPERSRKDV